MKYLRKLGVTFLICLLIILPVKNSSADERYGKFIGEVVTKWLENEGPNRKMEVIQDISFIDKNEKEWNVPEGAIVDGASIPVLFWRVIGSPFVGDYRTASVIHDHYCEIKSENWRDVHKMFYYASRAAGVNEIKAKVMYAAVFIGGPRWGFRVRQASVSEVENGLANKNNQIVEKLTINTQFAANEAEERIRWIESENPSLEEIQGEMEALIVGYQEQVVKAESQIMSLPSPQNNGPFNLPNFVEPTIPTIVIPNDNPSEINDNTSEIIEIEAGLNNSETRAPFKLESIQDLIEKYPDLIEEHPDKNKP